MALGDVIARLSVQLGLETAAFEKGATVAEKRLAQTQRKLENIGKRMSSIGRTMSVAITAPVAAAGAAVIKMSGDFEASMNRLSISTQANAGSMQAMNELALQLGKNTMFGATEAADAMDMLAKNGLSAKEILNGAATAAVNLASAAGSDLSPAANAVTDVMQQFKLSTDQLPNAVNQITGAVNQSKLDFEDFSYAIGQAGGAAGAAGVGFADFNASIAGTASLFASGQDAGTSFKTFLTSLPGKSSTAKGAIEELGLQFYTANGSLRSMSEIAQELQDKLSGLSDVAKQQYLTQIFGTDAMRTAIGLMDLGAAGLDDIKVKIAQTDAAAQSAQRLKGFNGQLEQLKGAAETLAIRIGQSGVLEAVTGLVTTLADFLDVLSDINPGILKFVVVVATIAAAVGPVLIGLGAMVNATTVLLPLLVTLAPAIGAVGAAFLASLGPLALVGVAVGAVFLAYKNWDKIEAILQRLYAGAKKWIQEGLTRVLQFVLTPIAAVKRAFFDLYDAVVGNSYVPDMVDGIASQMTRLDAVMVSPVKAATSAAEDAFRDMAGNVQGLLDHLFPEVRRLLDYRSDLATIAGSDLDAATKAEAQRRAGYDLAGIDMSGRSRATLPDTGPLANVDKALEQLDRLETKLPDLTSLWGKFKGAAEDAFGEVSYQIKGVILGAQSLASALKNIALNLAGRLLDNAFNSLGNALFGSIPRFATGTNFAPGGLALVGERGPELVNLPRGSQVVPNHDMRNLAAGGGSYVQMQINTPNADSFRRSERQVTRDMKRRLA